MALVNSKDLTSVNKEILLFNLTSSTEFLDYSQIIFSEFYDQGIKLILPLKVCSHGHSLLVAICKAGLAKKVAELLPNSDSSWAEFVGIGRVESFEKQNDSMVAIEIKFTQYKALDWDKIVIDLRQAQQKVDEALDKMKAS